MKKKADPRHLARRETIQKVFEWGFRGETEEPNPRTVGIMQYADRLDQIIQTTAPQWPLSQINRIDLSILRLAIYELLFRKDIPPIVSINEAIDLTKVFSNADSKRFVNGILDKIKNSVKRPLRTPEEENPSHSS